MENKDWREQYPLTTFTGETRKEIESLIESVLKSKQEEIEGEMEEMKKTKTTGFLNVIWGEKLRSKIPAMSDTDVSYNKALDELKPIISNLLK